MKKIQKIICMTKKEQDEDNQDEDEEEFVFETEKDKEKYPVDLRNVELEKVYIGLLLTEPKIYC